MMGGNVMEKVPKMISTKDLSYIKDMFNWNYLTLKKLQDYSECIEAEGVSEQFKELIDLHQDNCKNLIKLLGDGDK